MTECSKHQHVSFTSASGCPFSAGGCLNTCHTEPQAVLLKYSDKNPKLFGTNPHFSLYTQFKTRELVSKWKVVTTVDKPPNTRMDHHSHLLSFRIQFKYGDTWGPVHGATTGYTIVETNVSADHYIFKVTSAAGWIYDGLEIFSQNGDSLGLHGRFWNSLVSEERVFAYVKGKACLTWNSGVDAFCDVYYYYLHPN